MSAAAPNSHPGCSTAGCEKLQQGSEHSNALAAQRLDLRVYGTKLIFRTMLVEKSAPTVFTALDDGTGVLLNLETLFYYTLNKTGVALWQEIERNSSSTLDSLVKTVCKRFDVDEEVARQGIAAFVTRLAEFKMVRVF